MTTLAGLRVKLFADGADLATMLAMAKNPLIRGFTTNPTLMRKAGVDDYRTFASVVLDAIRDRPISFEVFSDEFDEMERQAREIAGWGANVYVKIPVTNTRGDSSTALIRRLAAEGVKLNITAVLTMEQVRAIAPCLAGGAPSCVSVFAGRIADTGVDPVPTMAAAVDTLRPLGNVELIWASPRELLNVFQADVIGCHIITATSDILQKLALVGKDLAGYSLDTVRMFRDDAVKAGYRLSGGPSPRPVEPAAGVEQSGVGGIVESIRVKQRLLAESSDVILKTGRILADALLGGSKVLLLGNGGSAAEAQHIAAELVGRFARERGALPALALSSDAAALTALGNDYGFERVFARQLEALARAGDVVVALSTSGLSANVLAAVMVARDQGCVVLGVTGADGRRLAGLCDAAVVVPSTDSARIQEASLTIGHVWCEIVDAAHAASSPR